MTAKFSVSHTYDAPVAQVFALMTDPDFLERKARHFGATWARVTRQAEADGAVVLRIETKSPAKGRPGEDHLVITHRYDVEAMTASWTSEPRGFEDRATAGGTLRYVALGPDRCEATTDGSIEIRLPLIGKRLEKTIQGGLRTSMDAEAEFIRAALDDQAGS